MPSAPFASCARRPGAGLAELAIAVAAEFRPVDAVGVAHELTSLARELDGGGPLPAAALLDALTELMSGFRPTSDPLDRRPLMLDEVLRTRVGDPLVLALLATDVGRRAGLDVAMAAGAGVNVVAHRQWPRPFALHLDAPGARVGHVPAHTFAWLCPHQAVRRLLGELVDRFRRGGDLSAAIHAAELRLALPLDRHGRAAMRAELAGVRAALN